MSGIRRTIVTSLIASALTLLTTPTRADDRLDFFFDGRLTEANGKPVAGPISMQLSFFHDAAGTDPVLTVTHGLESVPLQDGVFQLKTSLSGADYHKVFAQTGQPVYVQITDLTNAPSAPYPLQQVGTVPFAGKVPVDGKTIAFDGEGRARLLTSGAGGAGQLLSADGSGALRWVDPPTSVVTQVNGVPAANVASGATAANQASSTAGAGTIVKRDDAGGFAVSTVAADALILTAPSAAAKPLTVKGAAGQSANLQEWLSSTGSLLAGISADGGLKLGSGAQTVSLKAPSGMASSTSYVLPAAPDNGKYLMTDANGNLSWSTPTIASAGFAPALGSVGAPSYAFTGDSDTGMWSPGTDTLNLSTAGVERFRLDASGRLGLGTTAPAAQLEVKAGALSALTGTVAVTAGTTAVTGTGSFFTSEVAVGDALRIGAQTLTVAAIADDTHLTLSAASTDGAASATAYTDGGLFRVKNGAGTSKLTLNKSGNLGIGAASPGQKLTVDGTLGILEGGATPTHHSIFQGGDQAGDITYTLPTAQGSSGSMLTNNGAGILSWTSATVPAAGTIATLEGNETFTNKTLTSPTINGGTMNAAQGTVAAPSYSFAGDANTGMSSSAADTLNFSTNGTERLRIQPSGAIGIGTTAPAAKMHIALNDGGAISSNDAQLLIQHTAAAPYPYAGIRLDHHNTTAGNQGGSFLSFTNDTIAQGAIQFDYIGSGGFTGTDGNLRLLNNGATGSITLETNGTEKLRVNGSGKVGVGTTSPGSLLHLREDAATGDVLIIERQKADSSGILTFDRAGASGTAVPSGQVLGRVLFNGYDGSAYRPGGFIDMAAVAAPGASSVRSAFRVSVFNDGVGAYTTFGYSNNKLNMPSDSGYFFNTDTNVAGNFNPDTGLTRNAAGIVEINNGTAGQYRDLQVRSINPVSGNVGIGTTTPSTNLDVAGSAKISTSLGVGVAASGTQGSIALAGAAGASAIAAATTDVLTISAAGGGKSISFASDNIYFRAGGGTWGTTLYNGGTAFLDGSRNLTNIGTLSAVGTGNSSFGGNVGIGTTSPLYLGDIRNSNGASQLHLSGSNADSGAYFTTTGNDLFMSAGASYNAAQWIAKATTASLVGESDGAVRLYTNSGLTAGSPFTPTERLRVDTSGNVGIGTTSPSARLQLTSTSSSNVLPSLGTIDQAMTSLYLTNSNPLYGLLIGTLGTGPSWLQAQRTDASATAYSLLLNPSGGNVGIGTTSPSANLHIASATTSRLMVQEGATQSSNESLGVYASNGTTPRLSLKNMGSERIGLGVGTAPLFTEGSSVELGGVFSSWSIQNQHVNGAVNDVFRLANSGGSVPLVILPAGNVGIGTTAPAYTLDVNGTIRATNLITTSAGGYSSPGAGTSSEKFGANAAAAGNYTVAIGNGASAVDTGNVMIGYNAASPGHLSTAIGYNANANGSDATAVGSGAQSQGNYGSALGGGAISGGRGVAIGYGANSSGGSDGIAIGMSASTTAANQFVAGSANYAINDIYFGKGASAVSPTDYTIRGTGASGAGTAGGNLSFAGGLGGSAADSGGSISLKTAAAGTGTTLNERMRIDSSGNVGIGTTAPGSQLHVAADSNAVRAGIRLQDTNASGNTWEIAPGEGTGNLGNFAIRDVTASDALRLVIAKSTGNVGIGTTTPSSPLTVSRSSLTTGDNVLTVLGETSGAGNQNAGALFSNTASFDRFQLAIQGDWGSELQLLKKGSATVWASFGASWGAGDLDIKASNSNAMNLHTGGSPRLTVLSTGNVGIGTTTPLSKLDIASSITNTYPTPGTAYGNLTLTPSGTNDDSASLTFRAANNGTLRTGAQAGIYVQSSTSYGTKMYFGTTDDYSVGSKVRMAIDHVGNVGIGTTVPGSKLAVHATGEGAAIVTIADDSFDPATSQGKILFTTGGASVANIAGKYASGTYRLALGTGSLNAENLSILASGNVGIGTTSPTTDYKLDTIGSGRFEGSLCVKNATGACAGTTAGTIYANTTTISAADLAEHMPIEDESLLPGDVVAIDRSASTGEAVFSKTNVRYQSGAFGVISTSPGVTLGADSKSSRPVALAGRVPANVTLEGGSIAIGDYLVASSTAGKAMKATDPSQGGIIGIALSTYEGTSVPARDFDDGIAHEQGHQVMMLVQPGASSQAALLALKAKVEKVTAENAEIKAALCQIQPQLRLCK